MRSLIALLLLMTTPALAEIIEVPTTKTVDEATDAFVAAVEGAGAKVFAVVDHDAGAASIGSPIDDVHLVVFGNPKVGTPAMAISPLAGIGLPLHVLIYKTADGSTHFAYEEPGARLAGLTGQEMPAEVIAPMAGALKKLTAKAAE